MIAQQFFCLICITVIHNRTVVAGKDDQGVFSQSQPVEFVEDLSDTPVKLHDSVASQSHRVLASEAVVREAGNMYVVCREIHEEGFILVCFDEIEGMCRDGICQVFIFP